MTDSRRQLPEQADVCPQSKRVDDPTAHTWLFDGDDPYIVCAFCGERRSTTTGKIVPESPDPEAHHGLPGEAYPESPLPTCGQRGCAYHSCCAERDRLRTALDRLLTAYHHDSHDPDVDTRKCGRPLCREAWEALNA